VYEDLAQMDTVFIDGVPADLVGRIAACEVLGSLGESEELRQAALGIYQDLLGARWILDRSSYEFFSEEVIRWLDEAAVKRLEESDALVLTAAVEWLWDRWQRVQLENEAENGRRSIWVRGKPALVVWQSTPEELWGFVAGRAFVESQWHNTWEAQGVRLLLADSEGHVVIGDSEGLGRPQVVRIALETQLPWTMRAAFVDPALELPEFAARQRLLWVGLGIMLLVVIGSGYFTTRAIARELNVARIQSDFVSAVSHEFRTPLTAIRHLVELLEGGVVTEGSRRRQYYSVLSRETKRLHRLVEGLLNFGRMEAGTFPYRLEVLDPGELVKEVIEEFRQEHPADRHEIRLQQEEPVPLVKADREALGRVIWNLLDNAIRYSVSCLVVEVEVTRHTQSVVIRVRDSGPGIPAAEQKEIFRKFVRGSTSESARGKGAGIGLAIVQHIVGAHGGEVTLDSAPGKGSTFSVFLPALEEES
jgi:signal transduction histidine kinase